MEHIDHDPIECSSNSIDGTVEPGGLLEECWFFGNLLDKKTKKAMLRSYSDPCPSSSSIHTQEMLAINSSGGNKSPSIKKLSRGSRGFDPPHPWPPGPPPPRVAAREEKATTSKSIPRSSQHNLLRTPSLPPCIGREEDAESDFTLSKLIRQASLNPSDVLPPRRNSKGLKRSTSTPRHRPRKNPELEGIDIEVSNETRRRCIDQTKLRKSLSDVESKVAKGFKDYGFKFDRKDQNQSADMSSAPRIPSWLDRKNSSTEDMKAQIKFWARAVAANVR